MSVLRISTPDRLQLIDQGPAHWYPIPGFSYRPHAITGGTFVSPAPQAVGDHRREQLAAASARYRARKAT